MVSSTLTPTIYPSGDGQPIAESYVHVWAIVAMAQVLTQYRLSNGEKLQTLPEMTQQAEQERQRAVWRNWVWRRFKAARRHLRRTQISPLQISPCPRACDNLGN